MTRRQFAAGAAALYADPLGMPIGRQVYPVRQLFAAAKKGGVGNYFVEMDMDALKASYPFLHEMSTD